MADKQPDDVEKVIEEAVVNSGSKENEGGGWWDSLYSAAKSKSAEVLESVKRDLGELTTIVTTETSNIVLNTTNVVKDTLQLENPESTANTMKKSVSSFLDQMSSALNPLPDDEDEAIMIVGSDTVTLSRLQAQIYTLANDPNTFVMEIDDQLDKRYKAWLDWVKSGDSSLLSNDKLTKILNECTPLRDNYQKLVPDSVSHADFWYRFLFRKALLEDEDAKQQRRSEKENREAERIDFNKELTPLSDIELSEKEQEEILSSYDQERRVSSKSSSPIEDIKKDSKSKQEDIPSNASSVTTSSLDKDEWVKDFDIEDIEPPTNTK
ncbi:BSD domain-containing protein 1-like isoform X1 [Metopolophium dirhodum]|uniref:BSD domain-containing protein 1-like isoform X1 n=1 Tax=Metopolophium dirhodum TaxID=44670 RepID=UPI00298FBD1F|nr:BSD domain-containing protein 1-like isoform X1 [Metopolophium dirhodum]